MPRHRLVLAAVAAAVLGAWWLLSDGLTAEERRLVGVWRTEPAGGGWFYCELGSDGAFRWGRRGTLNDGNFAIVDFTGRWAVRSGQIVLDAEPNGLRRPPGQYSGCSA
jgi:hypothetical protein